MNLEMSRSFKAIGVTHGDLYPQYESLGLRSLEMVVDAVIKDLDPEGIAFVASPRLFITTTIRQLKGDVLSDAFELRCADANSEYRWLRVDSTFGWTVHVSDRVIEEADSPDHETMDSDWLGHRDSHHLVWGTVKQSSGGVGNETITLFDGRIGLLTLPAVGDLAEGPPKGSSRRVVVQLREYLSLDRFGNVGMADRRVLGLGWFLSHTAHPKRSGSKNHEAEVRED